MWIDELMDGPDNAPLYVQHFTHFWRRQLLAQTPRQSDTVVAPLEAWLRKQIKANTPYDRLAVGLLTDPQASGVLRGQRKQGREPGQPDVAAAPGSANWNAPSVTMTAAAASGSARSSGSSRHSSPGCSRTGAEALVGGPRPTKGGPARIRVGETNTWVQTRFPDGSRPDWKRAVTPRQALAEWITRRDNPWFARALVNRLWQYFFGVGPDRPGGRTGHGGQPAQPSGIARRAGSASSSLTTSI